MALPPVQLVLVQLQQHHALRIKTACDMSTKHALSRHNRMYPPAFSLESSFTEFDTLRDNMEPPLQCALCSLLNASTKQAQCCSLVQNRHIQHVGQVCNTKCSHIIHCCCKPRGSDCQSFCKIEASVLDIVPKMVSRPPWSSINKMSRYGLVGFAVPTHLALLHVAEILAVWHAVEYCQ